MRMNIRDFIEYQSRIYHDMGAPNQHHRFLLEVGYEMKPGLVQPPLMRPKECFSNALHYALAHKLLYVEGFALRHGIGILIDHAWCCTDDGVVVDPTWSKSHDCQYFGVPMDAHCAAEEAVKNGIYGLFWIPQWNKEFTDRLRVESFVLRPRPE